MTFALLAALILQTGAFLWLLRGKDERTTDTLETERQAAFALMSQERETHHAETQALLNVMREAEATHRAELVALFTDHRAEVQILCQRIQAPEIAVVAHQQDQAGDENPYPLTDEETAQAQQEQAQWIAEVERRANEGVFS